eukprot:scaffold31070_cov15-Prasinocladus_malaysianus.AAC.1
MRNAHFSTAATTQSSTAMWHRIDVGDFRESFVSYASELNVGNDAGHLSRHKPSGSDQRMYQRYAVPM